MPPSASGVNDVVPGSSLSAGLSRGSSFPGGSPGQALAVIYLDRFVDAVHTATPHGGCLKLVMGRVEIDFHY